MQQPEVIKAAKDKFVRGNRLKALRDSRAFDQEKFVDPVPNDERPIPYKFVERKYLRFRTP